MSKSLQALVENRAALLLAEASAWLHDYEKCTDEHLKGTTKNAPQSASASGPAQYLSLLGTHTFQLLGEQVTITELISQRRSSSQFITDTSQKWLIRSLGFCHSAAHTEKADRSYYYSLQDFHNLRGSSPFGYDFSSIIGSGPSLTTRLTSLFSQLRPLLLDISANRFLCRQHIEDTFSYVLADTRRPLNEVTLWDWSSMVAALYKSAIAQMLIDDPVKPPTLPPMCLHWRLLGVRIDAVAFSQNIARMPDLKSRQDLLKDGLDKVRILLEEEYPLGTEIYRDTNGSIFIVPNIPYLLDLENNQGKSLANLIRKYFSTSTVKGNILLQLGDEIIPALEFEPHKQAWFWDDSASHHDPLPIVDHITQTPASYTNQDTVRSWWQDHSEDICAVCQLRPQGWGAADNKAHYDRRARGVKCPSKPACRTCKALERKVCAICEERREDRSEQWAGDLKSTIWIDEVADANGRLALIVGKFGLEYWLDGTMIFYPAGQDGKHTGSHIALKIRNMGMSLTERQVLKIQRNEYAWDDSLGILKSLTEIKEEQIPHRFKDDQLQVDTTQQKIKVTDVQKLPNGHYRMVLNQILSGFAIGDSCRIRGRYFQVVQDGSQVEATGNKAISLVEDQILHPGCLLVEQTIRLYAMEEAQTPARLFRIWETTLQFWQNLQGVLDDELDMVGTVSLRLRIQVALPETELGGKLARFHTYELKLRNINLSVTKVADLEFITVDNLQRIAILLNPSKAKEYREDYEKAAEYVYEQLQELCRANKPIEVEEPTGYGNPNKPLGKLNITSVNRENTPYVPAISILTEPRTFMVIVPANKALQVMQAIKRKYEKEMGKVRSRLPLITGIVFAGARTPLSAILDAGRRLLNQPATYEQWKIKRLAQVIESPNHGPWPSKVDFVLEKDEHILQMKVPTVIGDGTTPDEWYPYWRMEAPIPDRWVLASDLGEGDMVSFMPSRFDFEFLDTAARRFEINYDASGKRRGGSHPARPYYLEQLDEFEMLWNVLFEGLETTQIDNLVGLIEEKRMEWLADHNDEVFKQTVHDILNNANWRPLRRPKPESETFEQLYRAALSGQLADVVEVLGTPTSCSSRSIPWLAPSG
jgi:CRISPR-associated Csx11 family protein